MGAENHRRQCEFQLLRYVPDAVRNEYVHIGVILREQGGAGPVEVKFTRDWRRVRCLDPDVDTAMLESVESELRLGLAGDADGKLKKILDEALSLNIQITSAKGYLVESLAVGLEELMRVYVDAPARERISRLSGRAAIQAAMRSEFEKVGVWDLLRKKIAASEYTRPGDPLRLDMGYKADGLVRIFQAVSFEPGVEMAKVLAFSAEALHAGVERVEKAPLDLTAIVEPAAKVGATEEDPERMALYRFGVETMEEHRIHVMTTADLGRIAEKSCQELLE